MSVDRCMETSFSPVLLNMQGQKQQSFVPRVKASEITASCKRQVEQVKHVYRRGLHERECARTRML